MTPKWARVELNHLPTTYKAAALTGELRAQKGHRLSEQDTMACSLMLVKLTHHGCGDEEGRREFHPNYTQCHEMIGSGGLVTLCNGSEPHHEQAMEQCEEAQAYCEKELSHYVSK